MELKFLIVQKILKSGSPTKIFHASLSSIKGEKIMEFKFEVWKCLYT